MNLTKTYLVYKHTAPNGKCYVGITCQNPIDRWGRHGNGYKGQPKFYNAILKYGWENFRHEIIETGLSLDEAKVREQYYVSFYDSFRHGYNADRGGNDVRGQDGIPVVQYTMTGEYVCTYPSIADASNASGAGRSPIRAVMNGKLLSSGGYIWRHPGESVNVPDRPIVLCDGALEFSKRKKPRVVLQFTETGEYVARYDCLHDAAAKTGCKRSAITESCCQKKHPLVQGQYFFMYQDAPYEICSPEQLKRSVYCSETNTVYPTVRVACKRLNIDMFDINAVCCGKMEAVQGFHFSFV